MDEFPATDWTHYDVPAIAAMLTDSNRHSWDQVSAWRRIATTLDTHQVAMAAAIDQLAQTWPPDVSPAAAEYLGYAQAVRVSAQATAEAAYANAAALTSALTALDQARTDIDTLHDTWQALPDTEGTDGLATDQILAVKADLNHQAAHIMTQTDQAILAAARRLQTPPVLTAPSPIGKPIHPVTDGSDGFAGGPASSESRRTGGSTTGGEFRGDSVGGIGSGAAPSELTTSDSPPAGPPSTLGAGISSPITTTPSQVDTPPPGVPGEPGGDLEGDPSAVGEPSVPDGTWEDPGRATRIRTGGSARLGLTIGETTMPSAVGAAEPTSASSPISATTGFATATRESFGPIGAGMAPVTSPAATRATRRRTRAGATAAANTIGVPGLITPSTDPDPRHDPGPHVIGIDR